MIVIVVVVREVRKTLCRVGGRGGGRWLTVTGGEGEGG